MFAGLTQDILAGMNDTPNRELQTSSQGRFLSPDPAGQGWNQYGWPTNPNSFSDPSGLEPKHEPSGCSPLVGCTIGAPQPSGDGGPFGYGDLDVLAAFGTLDLVLIADGVGNPPPGGTVVADGGIPLFGGSSCSSNCNGIFDTPQDVLLAQTEINDWQSEQGFVSQAGIALIEGAAWAYSNSGLESAAIFFGFEADPANSVQTNSSLWTGDTQYGYTIGVSVICGFNCQAPPITPSDSTPGPALTPPSALEMNLFSGTQSPVQTPSFSLGPVLGPNVITPKKGGGGVNQIPPLARCETQRFTNICQP
jgi:hypothetical protein